MLDHAGCHQHLKLILTAENDMLQHVQV